MMALELEHNLILESAENMFRSTLRYVKCQECGLVFDRASQLEYHHRSIHLGEKSHICQTCGKGFFRKSDLRTHENTHIQKNLNICELCGKKFNHVSNRIRHYRTHSGIKPYPCSFCGRRFTQASSLCRHRRAKICQKNNDKIREDNIISDPITDNGKTTLKDNGSELNNTNTHIGMSQRKIIKRQHYCKVCGESFQYIVLLRKHEKEHIKSNQVFECGNCKKNFLNFEDIKEHSCKKETRTINLRKKSNTSVFETGKSIKHDTSIHDVEKANIKKDYIFSKDLTAELNYDKQAMETVVYVEAKQMAHINLEEFEEVSSHFLRDHVMEFANISDIFNICNSENVDFEKEISALDVYSDVNSLGAGVSKILDVEGCSQMKADVTNCVPEKQTSKENVKSRQTVESKSCFKSEGNFKEYTLELQEYSTTDQYFLNTESHSPTTSLELESVNPKEIVTNNEPTLRLVQTETGEQFYELVMDNISEKPQSQDSKSSESIDTISESADNFENLELFRADTQSNFEIYTESNFETFDRSNYESRSQYFLDMIHGPNLNNNEHQFSGINNIGKQIEKIKISKDIVYFEKNNGADQDLSVEEEKKSNTEMEKTTVKKKANNKKFYCDICHKTLSTRHNFTQHMGTHYKNHQRFRCMECGKFFAWKSTLNKHIYNNHRPEGKQTYVCNICPKVYCKLSQVNEHVKRDHLKERKHVCPHCGKSFFKKFDWKTHCRTHTNEKPFKCSFCQKSFHHQSHKIRHERVHSGEKPYVCDICQKDFCQRSSLKAHRQKHRPIKIDLFEYRMDEDDPLALSSL